MKKNFNTLKTVSVVAVLLLSFIACDKDFTTIGNDVIGSSNFEVQDTAYSAISYNKMIDPVQSNGLPANLLGFHHDPIYGFTNASIVSQMIVQTQPTGVDILLDSVVVTLPYYSHASEDDSSVYLLDSVYGNSEVAMKLSLYRNNYFLRDFDPNTNFEDNQNYYSDGSTAVGSMIPSTELESELIYETEEFVPYSDQINLTEINSDGEEEVTQILNPSLLLVFKEGEGTGNNIFYSENLQFWQDLIIDKVGEPELSNVNNFKEYFRGLYFKLEPISGDGSMIMFDLSSSSITLYYKSVSSYEDIEPDNIPDSIDSDVGNDGTIDDGLTDTDGDGIIDAADMDADNDGMDDEDKTDINNDGFADEEFSVSDNTSVLSFSGNTINFFENNFNSTIENANNNANDVTGDEKLYLKGGQGSMAIINLFGGEDSDEFAEFVSHQDDWLINEANLVFYEDENITNIDDHEFDRLYLYDLDNNTPIIDYYFDIVSTTSPYYSVVNHLGQRFQDDAGNYKFKIRITEHLNNILLKDSTNTKLGLVMSNNVNVIDNSDILGATNEDDVNKVPTATVLSPKGTVLYGNNTTNSEKKVKLEIYYTEPNN